MNSRLSPTGRHVGLAALLAWHDRRQNSTALPENLGDGALYFANPVYRAVRDAAVAAGCRYTLDDAHGYFAWPLTSLTRVLASKLIPYRKTRAALAHLDAARPRFFTTKHLELVEHHVNAVLHESAHCVADVAWQGAAPKLAALSADQRVVLRYAFGEACANAAEIAAMAHAEAPEERWGLALNSYWGNLPSVRPAWLALSAKTSATAAARWLILCFVASNLGRDDDFPALEKPLAALSGIDGGAHARAKKELRLFAAEAFNLNPEFRHNTATLFYASLGLTARLEKLYAFDFVAAFAADPALAGLLATAAALLAGDGATAVN